MLMIDKAAEPSIASIENCQRFLIMDRPFPTFPYPHHVASARSLPHRPKSSVIPSSTPLSSTPVVSSSTSSSSSSSSAANHSSRSRDAADMPPNHPVHRMSPDRQERLRNQGISPVIAAETDAELSQLNSGPAKKPKRNKKFLLRVR